VITVPRRAQTNLQCALASLHRNPITEFGQHAHAESLLASERNQAMAKRAIDFVLSDEWMSWRALRCQANLLFQMANVPAHPCEG
jgi:hypothetical protein